MPKRCKTCDCVMSMYNPNDYCFAHLHDGVLKESNEKPYVPRQYTPRKKPKEKNKYPGVRLVGAKWRATPTKDGKTVYLGVFDTQLKAHNAILRWRRDEATSTD